MDEAAFAARLEEARRKIEALPASQQGPLRRLLDETQERHAELRSNFSRIHDALSDWKMHIQYLFFDLEATKRELAELKRRQADPGGESPEQG